MTNKKVEIITDIWGQSWYKEGEGEETYLASCADEYKACKKLEEMGFYRYSEHMNASGGHVQMWRKVGK